MEELGERVVAVLGDLAGRPEEAVVDLVPDLDEVDGRALCGEGVDEVEGVPVWIGGLGLPMCDVCNTKRTYV